MSAVIENPANCEMRAVIRFLSAKNYKLIEIHWQLCEVYGDKIITEGQWYIRFKNGRTNVVHDEERSGRPSIVTAELVGIVDAKVQENN